MTTDRDASPPASRTVLALMALALLGMFAWSFAYRIQNPSLTAALERAAPREEGGMPGAGSMNAVMAAMNRLKANPDDLDALLEAAEAFMSAEMWDKAMLLLERARGKAPDDPEVLNHLGVALFRMERPAESAKAFERLLELDPGSWQARFNLGAVYKHGLNDPARAKPLFEAVLDNPRTDLSTRDQAKKELADMP